MKTANPAAGVVILLFVLPALAEVNETASERRFSVPSAPVSVTIPREDWMLDRQSRRLGDTAAYYVLYSPKRQVFCSVYLDKTDTCKTADACLEAALKGPSYKDARDLKKQEQGPFRIAGFYLEKPQGAPLIQANVLASAYVGGVRINLHLSKVGKDRAPIPALVDVLKTVSVK